MKKITLKDIEEINKYLQNYSTSNYKVEIRGNESKFLKLRETSGKIITNIVIKDLSEDSFNFNFIGVDIDKIGLYALFCN